MFLLSLDLCLVEKKKRWQKFYWSAQMNFVSLNQTFFQICQLSSLPTPPWGDPRGLSEEKAYTSDHKITRWTGIRPFSKSCSTGLGISWLYVRMER